MIHKVECSGNDEVVIEKLFGPLDFCELRIVPRLKDCKWVIERKVHSEDEPTFTWVLVAEVDGQ